ncbi:glucose dehydrogenase [FAD, quinone]-like [Musca vetustissima]|uniref:glucose dehydrogenase [FAD, quinone]-like n=1 Tax=Musca vetustissima TaxID=27455 RepID=UPI002AB62C51|nr:glucose dehydrogenase [FAD, quinone]-like [Musca vetustissima]
MAPQCPAPSVGAMNALVTLLIESLHTASCGLTHPEEYPPDYGQDVLLQKEPLEFDFVIVGGGTAGSVVASRLSENPKWNILLLEAGGDPITESEVPLLFVALRDLKNIYKLYAEPSRFACKAFEDERCSWIQGKGLGGSGSINGLIHITGFAHDFNNWRQLGSTGWAYKDLQPYIEKIEKNQGNSSHPRGYLDLGNFEAGDEDIIEIISTAAEELGQPRIRDLGGLHNMGYAIVRGTVSRGRRSGTAKGYLGRVAASRSNLKIIKNAQVTKLRFDGKGQTLDSLDFVVEQNKRRNVKVVREAILSAGAFNSAKLLMLSGIGPKDNLQALKIPILQNLPVGRNLQDHLVTFVFYKFPQEVDGSQVQNMIYQYLMHNRGPLATIGATRLVGFVKSHLNLTHPDLEMHHMFFRAGNFFALNTILSGLGMKSEYKNFVVNLVKSQALLMLAISLVQPKAKGRMRLKSKAFKDPPIIKSKFLSLPEDREAFVRGLEYFSNFENTKSFRTQQMEIVRIPMEECDRFEFKSRNYWLCYTKYFTNSCYNVAGTVRMGAEEDMEAVVNSRLKVKGVRNLRVADASIMPSITSANINGPTIIIGEKAADMIKEDWAED